jgi:hypothetical protein
VFNLSSRQWSRRHSVQALSSIHRQLAAAQLILLPTSGWRERYRPRIFLQDSSRAVAHARCKQQRTRIQNFSKHPSRSSSVSCIALQQLRAFTRSAACCSSTPAQPRAAHLHRQQARSLTASSHEELARRPSLPSLPLFCSAQHCLALACVILSVCSSVSYPWPMWVRETFAAPGWLRCSLSASAACSFALLPSLFVSPRPWATAAPGLAGWRHPTAGHV